MYLNPSQIATVRPHDVPNKNVVVLSNVWCNGKNERNVSVVFMSIIWLNAYKSWQIAYCEIITAFDTFVVPDVNNIIDIFLLSILTFL